MGRKPKTENQEQEVKQEQEFKEKETNKKEPKKETSNYKGGFQHIVTYKSGKRTIEEFVKPINASNSFLLVMVDSIATVTPINIGIRDYLDKHKAAIK